MPFPRAEITLATQSFGQGLTATPLQITAAMGVIANGGVLLRPRIVKRVVDPATGEVLEEPGPEVVRRVVSAGTAATISRWLVGVVEDPKGTGKRARLDGWRVAGKTGTAQKADPVSGGYSEDRRFSSFVGFAPAEAPRVVIGVYVDEPKGDRYGGEVAAPAFREIAEYAMKMLGVPPGAPAAAPGARRPWRPPGPRPPSRRRPRGRPPWRPPTAGASSCRAVGSPSPRSPASRSGRPSGAWRTRASPPRSPAPDGWFRNPRPPGGSSRAERAFG